jgi:hypothetical protein
MSGLACLGGPAVTEDLLAGARFGRRTDLERTYFLEAYAYAFLYDPEADDGLSADAFRRALSAELGVSFGTTYVPLSHSDLYRPHKKQRHHLSSEYLAAITPSRWSLLVADDLWQNRAVVAAWRILSCPPERAGMLTDAVTKIFEGRKDLLEAEA